MVSKCANPGCSAPFHYLREGKVFRMEIENGRSSEPQLVRGPRPVAHVEHFWLCGPCAGMMTLMVDNGKVVAVPLGHVQARRAAAS